MTGFKKRALIIAVFILLFIVSAILYTSTYSMSTAKAFEVNSQYQNKNLLIATQGSEFKDSLVTKVVETYKKDSIFIKVIDVSELSSIDPANYNALLVIHTWEYSTPPASVKLFIDRTQKYQDKIVVLTTSHQGSYTLENVDAITGESKIRNIPVFTEKIFARLNPLLK